MAFDSGALAKVLAQTGAVGAVVSLLVEQLRPFLPLRAVRVLVLVASGAFVYAYRLDALAGVGLHTPHALLAFVFNVLLVAGAAKVTNDGINAIDRAGDRR
jgi:hypothetical protein